MRECRKWLIAWFVAGVLVGVSSTATLAQTAGPAPTPALAESTNPNATPVGDGTFLLTIFLKHDQSKTLPKINEQLKEQGFFNAFPPPGVQVVSWYVMMGIGQVVTLRVPADKLRDVNRAIENTAWGGYRTEFYPTYDYKAVAEQMRAQNNK
jgi:hypothetical protein